MVSSVHVVVLNILSSRILKFTIEIQQSLCITLKVFVVIMVATVTEFGNSDFSPKKHKFTRPTEFTISQTSPHNGLQPPLTDTLSTHTFMLFTNHIQCTLMDSPLR